MATELPEDKIFTCIHHFKEEDIIPIDRTVQADGTYTKTVSAINCQYQVPLQFNRITDLRQIHSLIDDILNFEPNPELLDSSFVLVNIKEAATKL